jgi:hypothetical protein
MGAVHEDGHEGVQRTLHRLRRDFHFPNMKQMVQDMVRVCAVCQQYKSKHLQPWDCSCLCWCHKVSGRTSRLILWRPSLASAASQ